ncbi:universal stress protein [Halodesulfurarchaeum sp.]|uniref:universal stress protein n=1 Tax=Halodesulfurarchaeum sp. TaxID=1980530 RepID=UPI002FC390EB
MTYLVPFDGSELSEAALFKARLHTIALSDAPPPIQDEILREKPLNIVAVTVIPESARYAREKGWINADEEFRTRLVVERLHQQVTDIDPSAEFQFVPVDAAARSGTISSRLRQKAEELDADTIFIGSENAGRIVTPITSVAAGVTAKQDYDVYIIRNPLPEPTKNRVKSGFFS